MRSTRRVWEGLRFVIVALPGLFSYLFLSYGMLPTLKHLLQECRKDSCNMQHCTQSVTLSISFFCHYWQWQILINCIMCYYLYVLRWLMRPILALNCLLQIEQERSEEKSSVGDAFTLAFRCARFCLASLILFASYSPAPFLMRPRHFVRSCAICSHDSVGMLKSIREALRVDVLVSLLLTTMGTFSNL